MLPSEHIPCEDPPKSGKAKLIACIRIVENEETHTVFNHVSAV